MTQINLKGKTAEQAFVAIGEFANEQVPETLRNVLRGLLLDTGVFGDIQVIKTNEGFDFVAEVTEDDQRFAAEDLGYLLELVEKDPDIRAAYDKRGIVAYNGAVGDSCPCSVCNLRRAEQGPTLTEDMRKGMTRAESEQRATENYAKTGRTIPEGLGTDAVRAKADQLKGGLGSIESLLKEVFGADKVNVINASDLLTKTRDVLKDRNAELKEMNAKLAPDARKGLARIVGNDSEALADFDRLNELQAKERRTPEETMEMMRKLQRIVELVGM